jgi:hypothetical protein
MALSLLTRNGIASCFGMPLVGILGLDVAAVSGRFVLLPICGFVLLPICGFVLLPISCSGMPICRRQGFGQRGSGNLLPLVVFQGAHLVAQKGCKVLARQSTCRQAQ